MQTLLTATRNVDHTYVLYVLFREYLVLLIVNTKEKHQKMSFVFFIFFLHPVHTTCLTHLIFHRSIFLITYGKESSPVAVRSKAWVCGRSPAGITGSNHTGGMDVCLLWVLCVVR
jgi:hypothetical protein